MSADGTSDWEPSTDPRPIPQGQPLFARAGRGAPTTPTVDPYVDEVFVPARPKPYEPVQVRTLPSPPRQPTPIREQTPLREPAPPREQAPLHQQRPAPQASPEQTPPPAGPPPAGPGQPRRRWWLALVAVVAVLIGATAAVLAQQSMRTTEEPGAGPTGGAPPAPGASQPATAPSGKEGLGPGGNATPTPVPTKPPVAQPFPGVRRTLPGASIYVLPGENFAQALTRSDRSYGPLRMVRVFYPGLPPAWNNSRADVSNRTVVVSFKAHPRDVIAGRHDSRLAGWFASVPSQYDVYWTYFHEPENDVESGSYTTSQFRSAWRRVAGLAKRANNPKLHATLVLMCWTLNPNSRRNFNDYYPGGDVVDALGWDCYNSGTKNRRYTAPEAIFTRMIAKSRELGKPWGLAETGTARIPGDSGAGRAAWMRAMSTYLNSQKPLWVAYYDFKVPGGDFRLLDAPSQAAWRAFCSAAA